MTIPASAWQAFIQRMAAINRAAADEMRRYIDRYGMDDADALIRYAYALATRYGEAGAALAAEMYDAIAALSGAAVPAAEVAPTADYGDVAGAIYATVPSGSPEQVAAAVDRLTKLPGADTMLFNAIRDGAEWAWIPSGETCAFCLSIASYGWQPATRKILKGGHAQHIHGNCDCMFAIRFDGSTDVEGYGNGRRYADMFGTDGKAVSDDKVNALRRRLYAENSEEINEQKRSAYAKQRERESSAAEERNVGNP